MSEEIKLAVKAVEELGTAFSEFKATNDANLKNRDVVLEEKLAKIEAALDKAQDIADEAVLAVKRQQQRAVMDADGKPVDMEAKAASFARAAASVLDQKHVAVTADDLATYSATMDTYLRKGIDYLGEVERKALTVGGDPTGGYVVNPDMSGRIVSRVFDTSQVRLYASVQVISSDALTGLYDLDEAGAGWVGETSSRTETDTPDLGAWRIPVHEIYAKPKASQKMLDDAEINVETWLAGKVADKFARMEATAFVSGDGVSQPRGFLTYASGTTLPGTIERTITGVNGGFAAAPNGGDALITALHSLKPQYMANATWFMNRGTRAAVRKLKDSDGAYIWAQSLAAGMPSTLLGYPIAIFEDMPAIATDSLSIVVGDMRAAYQIVDRIGIRTLRDPFSSKPYIEFYTTKRVGGDVVNFEAIKAIEFTA